MSGTTSTNGCRTYYLYAFDALCQLSQQAIAGVATVAATCLFEAWGTRSVNSTYTAAKSDPYSGYGNSSGHIPVFLSSRK